MELQKIRNLSDDELRHHEKTTGEQLFRLRFQVSMGQTDGVKKLRQLRREIAQVKTVARERELGINGDLKEAKAEAAPAAEAKPKRAKKPAAKAAAKPAAKTAKKPAAKKAAKKPAAKKTAKETR